MQLLGQSNQNSYKPTTGEGSRHVQDGGGGGQRWQCHTTQHQATPTLSADNLNYDGQALQLKDGGTELQGA